MTPAMIIKDQSWIDVVIGGFIVICIIVIPICLTIQYSPKKCLKYVQEVRHIPARKSSFNAATAIPSGLIFGGWGFVAGGLIGANNQEAHDVYYDKCVEWEEESK